MNYTNNTVWNGPGFLLQTNGTLNRDGKLFVIIEDLNPDAQIRHCFSRMDMWKVAFWFIRNSWRAK